MAVEKKVVVREGIDYPSALVMIIGALGAHNRGIELGNCVRLCGVRAWVEVATEASGVLHRRKPFVAQKVQSPQNVNRIGYVGLARSVLRNAHFEVERPDANVTSVVPELDKAYERLGTGVAFVDFINPLAVGVGAGRHPAAVAVRDLVDAAAIRLAHVIRGCNLVSFPYLGTEGHNHRWAADRNGSPREPVREGVSQAGQRGARVLVQIRRRQNGHMIHVAVAADARTVAERARAEEVCHPEVVPETSLDAGSMKGSRRRFRR